MKPYRTILYVAVGLAVFMLACGQDAQPTRQPTSRAPAATTAAQPAAPTATSSPQTPPTDEPQGGIPVYEWVATWGADPSDGVSFTSPNGIAIDSSDNVYVTEFRGNRVQKFTPDGVLVTQWGSEGSAEGHTNRTQGGQRRASLGC